MTRIPPLLPDEVLARVLRLARFDGIGVLVVSGLFSLLSALVGDTSGAIFGLLIAGAGALELHGAGLLQHGEARGMNWLITSQMFLMFTILAYCRFQIGTVDVAALAKQLPEESKAQIIASGLSVEEALTALIRLTTYLVAIATVLYQGAMTIYYSRRRKAVAQALEPVE